jgi:PadR family transcriptional regulator, regulatory protein PadR
MDSRLLTGAVDMLVLEVLARGDSYGYQIAQSVLAESRGYFEMKEGSLYPALHRLERQKLLKAYWVETAEGRRRKYYRITPRGRAALREKRDEWSQFAAAVNGVLGASHAARPA